LLVDIAKEKLGETAALLRAENATAEILRRRLGRCCRPRRAWSMWRVERLAAWMPW